MLGSALLKLPRQFRKPTKQCKVLIFSFLTAVPVSVRFHPVLQWSSFVRNLILLLFLFIRYCFLFAIYSSFEILQSQIESKSFIVSHWLTNYLRKLMPERINDIRIAFVIRKKSGVPMSVSHVSKYSFITNR